MRIGFATPVSLDLLRDLVEDGDKMPKGFIFGPSASWIKELMRCGHHVTVYTTATEIEGPETYRGEGITIRIAKLRPWGCGRDFWAPERKQLKEMMLADKCDVIHAHWTYEFALAALATGIPTLVTIHDLPWRVLWYFRDPHRLARLLMAYAVALKTRRFTAVSQDAAAHFRRFFNPFAKVTVIPNGLPDSAFAMSDAAAHGIRPDGQEGCVFATILQGFTSRKNATAALKAFQIVRKQVPGARLLMFGTDYQPQGPAEMWARAHKLDSNVTFVGPLPYGELLERVRDEVDVVVHPSKDEAFSMAALEAMALKKPLVAGKSTPGMRDMLDEGKCGNLVDISKPAKIADAMARLALDPAYRLGKANAGYSRVTSVYRLDLIMAKYQTAYTPF